MTMNLDNINIRNACIDDLEQIVNIKINGWKSAYIDIIDSSILKNMSKDKEMYSYINKYSLNDVFAVENNVNILGFCRVYIKNLLTMIKKLIVKLEKYM